MKTRTAPRAAHGLGSAVWLQGLACGAVVALATPTAVLGALLLVPGIVALLMERRAGRPAARVALLCGVAAAATPVMALWQTGLGMSGAIAAASDPAILAACWAAQAAGWLLAQLAPVLLRLAFDARAAATAARLRTERTRYETEWGIPPAGEK